MANINKLAFMNEYYAYGRINTWGSRISTSSITYWKITWKYDTLETKTFGLVSTIRDVFPAAAAT